MPGAPLALSHLPAWLVERGLQGLPLAEQVDGFCRSIVEAGFRATRFNMSIGTLHPRHGAKSYVWRPDGIATELHSRNRTDEERESFERSPVYYLRSSGQTRLRRRIDAISVPEFPILADLRDAGMTDYAARIVPFNDGVELRAIASPTSAPDLLRGVFFSCATDDPEGFDEGHLGQVAELLPFLALAVKARATFDVAQTLLATYLGADAGSRVLTGEIDRHSVRTINAVIWFCDLRGFSRIASRIPQDELIELLDDYLEVMARPVLDHKGQILKFMGDGFLATFELDERAPAGACADALTAAETVVHKLPSFNAGRRARARQTVDLGVAIHLGEVLYGNIGTTDRLDFTVVGSAVNEASRIEGLCRPLGRNVLISSSVYDAADEARKRLVSLGFHALRGIREPRELFTIAGDRSVA